MTTYLFAASKLYRWIASKHLSCTFRTECDLERTRIMETSEKDPMKTDIKSANNDGKIEQVKNSPSS